MYVIKFHVCVFSIKLGFDHLLGDLKFNHVLNPIGLSLIVELLEKVELHS